tara:strand:- start:1545 stop:1961 length:417 start_codon:yes stop_codon:yes gene_type:complete
MKKYNHQEWLEDLKRQKQEFEEFKIDFVKRYKIAFAEGKINWLNVGFIPRTAKYLKEYKEQYYLGTYMEGYCVDWIPRKYERKLDNKNLSEKDKKIIEKEKELSHPLRNLFKTKVNKVTTGHEPKEKKSKKVRRDFIV